MARRKNRRCSPSADDRDAAPAAAAPPPSPPTPPPPGNSSPLVSLEMESSTMQEITRVVGRIVVDKPAIQEAEAPQPKKDPPGEPQKQQNAQISQPIHRSSQPADGSGGTNLAAAMHGAPSRALLVSGIPQHIVDPLVMQDLESWGPIRSFFLGARAQGCITVYYYDLRHAQDALLSIRSQYFFQQCNPARFAQHSYQNPQNHQALAGPSQPPQQSCGPKPYEPVKHELANIGFVTEDHLHRQQQQQPETIPPSASKFSPFAIPFVSDLSYSEGRGLIGGCPAWAEFVTISPSYPLIDSPNQGTLVVFYLRMNITHAELASIFKQYGDVREIREAPSRRSRFVEFYDIRDAARAKEALDGLEVLGRRIKIEFSRPCQPRNAYNTTPALYPSFVPYYPYYYNASSATPPYHQHDQTTETAYYTYGPSPQYDHAANTSTADTAYNFGRAAAFHYYVPGAYNLSYALGTGYYGYPNYSHHHYQQQQLYGYYNQQQQPQQQQYSRTYASAPPLLPSPRFNASVPRGYGRAGPAAASVTTRRRFEISAYNQQQPASLRTRDESAASASGNLGDGRGCIVSFSSERIYEESKWTGRKHRVVRRIARDESQYVFNTGEEEESGRTTLMIRNIPNKYSLRIVIRVLDQHCITYNNGLGEDEKVSAYDFVYLPVDFMNRSNLGYAFVNFTTVVATKRLHNDFHGRRWEEFKSRKGREQLEEHFKNSRFACDTDEYLPLVFSPPRTGLQCSSPTVVSSLAARKAGGKRLEIKSLENLPTPDPSQEATEAPQTSIDLESGSEQPWEGDQIDDDDDENFESEDLEEELDEDDDDGGSSQDNDEDGEGNQ
ncbi:protein terminal ear1 [Selaginella moellendorffii]|uniref:protein terminal ear1 n=1 Tax=Selaginella moellendorffii TaxID=88036 RepID=UPI000D1CBBDA|nr:protein terminal ear1 [Selaginella moellendorffii]|eukprot:XP_024530198.1 protein terminal ear1 [Selaginella moellendorffii]